MYIKNITIEHFGRFGHNTFHFNKNLNVIESEMSSELFTALCIVLGNQILRFQDSPYPFTPKSRIYAELELNTVNFLVDAHYEEDAPDRCAVRVYDSGRILEEDERIALFRTSEEAEECSYFINRYDYCRYVPFAELDFSKKFTQYRLALQDNREWFAKRSDRIGVTGTFRKILKNYCGGFIPEPINIHKRLWLTMDENFQFIAQCRRKNGYDLSETESVLFQFLCYVNVNRFWGEVQNLTGRCVHKPLFIHNLVYCLDECVDLKEVLKTAVSLNRQIYLFYGKSI